jgi:hypothetical protein
MLKALTQPHLDGSSFLDEAHSSAAVHVPPRPDRPAALRFNAFPRTLTLTPDSPPPCHTFLYPNIEFRLWAGLFLYYSKGKVDKGRLILYLDRG